MIDDKFRVKISDIPGKCWFNFYMYCKKMSIERNKILPSTIRHELKPYAKYIDTIDPYVRWNHEKYYILFIVRWS